ncbi:MAG: S8 family serine peptidase [Burkholderiaceae bacterium]|nr:S8 family serine peptidase [Burkholderiaceae bacterium]
MNARFTLSALALAAALTAQAQTQTPPPAPARQVISSADQLPRRTVQLPALPSVLLAGPREALQPLAEAGERQLRDDLARYDIQDAATQRAYHGLLLTLAQWRGDWAALPPLIERLRALQDKPGPRATTGVLATLLAEQQAGAKDAAWLRTEVQRRYGALAWADAGDSIKGLKGSLELLNPALVKGSFEQQLDVMARNANLQVPEALVGAILGARVQQDLVYPQRDAIVAGLQAVIDANATPAVAKPDVWTPRQFAIAADARATPVNVAVWDSGVDLALFKPAPGRGIAFDSDARPSTELLRPLGEAQSRWPQLRQQLKGAMDLRAALDTEDARALKRSVAALKPEQAKGFQEDLALAGLYTHGTHVAGIAVAGNPFARVYAATMLWRHTLPPDLPSDERAQRTAASYKATVDSFKAQGVRVVNMSWRYGAAAYEGALAWHNAGKDAAERQQTARRLFGIERDALREAIAGAPGILFVAGSGNEDNSADFEEYIPAGFNLPNLITVGAVNTAGEETSFSTFGKTVAVHANGFEVDSLLPGGDRARLSGTSMASPQVANLAAKLLALNPSLSVAQLKAAIVDGADARGRVRLVNPRKSAELLGLKP